MKASLAISGRLASSEISILGRLGSEVSPPPPMLPFPLARTYGYNLMS